MTVLPLLLDLIGFERNRITCELIDRLRPGHGHHWSDHCEPPACLWCGTINRTETTTWTRSP